MARKLIVEIVGDASSLEREFKRSAAGAKRFERQVGQIGRGTVGGLFNSMGRSVAFASAGFLSAAGLVSGMKASVNAASDLNEEINKSSVVFGKSGAAVRAWSKSSATALGLSQQAALEAAGGFGSMLETSGLVEKQAASMSQRLVQLGADMASFNNEDPSEMLDRLRSGLAGEAEPLRRFGVLLSENRVKQEAARLGLAKAGVTLSEQQKVQARYSLILGDTSRQQGDFARTSGGMANQMRILKAQITNTAAIIGKAFIPMVQDATQALNDWLADPDNQRKIQDNAKKTARFFGGIVDAVDKLNRGGELIQDTLESVFEAPLQSIPAVHRRLQQVRDDFQGIDKAAQQATTSGLSFAAALNESIGLKNTPGHAPGAQTTPAGVGGTGGRGGAGVTRAVGTLTPFLAYRLALAEATKGRGDDERVLGQIIRVLRVRLGQTKNLKERTALQEALNQYQGQLSGLLGEDAQVVKDAADKAKAARQKRRENARKAAQAAREARMVYETPLSLQLAEARAGAQWGHGTRDVLIAIRKAARKALRSGNLLVQGQIDAWNTIASANQRLADMNKSKTSRMITAYHATSAAMAHGGQQPNTGAAGVLGQPVILQLDGRTIATAVVPHIQRSTRRQTATTTGRSSGTVHGF